MTLLALPAFADNYIWMLHDGAGAVVVDPGEAAPVIAALYAHGLTLQAILVKHQHADQVGAVDTHEHTLSDLKFAGAVEPGNVELLHHTARRVALREWNNRCR